MPNQSETFSFEIKAEGELTNVFFWPELNRDLPADMQNKIVPTSIDLKKWKKEFSLVVSNPFNYVLRVFGHSGTSWTGTLKVKRNDQYKDFINWSGTTGDTVENASERRVSEEEGIALPV